MTGLRFLSENHAARSLAVALLLRVLTRTIRQLVADVTSDFANHPDANSQLVKSPVAVEKGTKAVISVNFSLYGGRTFNDLRTNFAVEIP